MNSISSPEWFAVLIEARLFGLAEREREARAALEVDGFKIHFASELENCDLANGTNTEPELNG